MGQILITYTEESRRPPFETTDENLNAHEMTLPRGVVIKSVQPIGTMQSKVYTPRPKVETRESKPEVRPTATEEYRVISYLLRAGKTSKSIAQYAGISLATVQDVEKSMEIKTV